MRFKIVLNDVRLKAFIEFYFTQLEKDNLFLNETLENFDFIHKIDNPNTFLTISSSLEQLQRELFTRLYGRFRTCQAKEWSNYKYNSCWISFNLSDYPGTKTTEGVKSFFQKAISFNHKIIEFEKANNHDLHFLDSLPAFKSDALILDHYFGINFEKSYKHTLDFLNKTNFHNNKLSVITNYKHFKDSVSKENKIKKIKNNCTVFSFYESDVRGTPNHDRFIFLGPLLIKSGPGFDLGTYTKSGFIDFYNLYRAEFSRIFFNAIKNNLKLVDVESAYLNESDKKTLEKLNSIFS
jgi:hypothetical protein